MIGIDWGIILMLIGAAMLCITPAKLTMTVHRTVRVEQVAPPLQRAFPVSAPSPAMTELADRAQAALDVDALSRGLRDVSAAYDQAARPA